MDAVGLAPRANVKFIFDGEEEIGSPYFGAFTEKHRDLLAADLVLVTDGPKHDSGADAGRRLRQHEARVEIEVAGRPLGTSWCQTRRGASSALAHGDARRHRSSGLEDDVVLPNAAERAMMAEIPVDAGALERDLGVKPPADLLDRLMFHPTLTIRGLHAGFLGKEANTIIPHRATVLLDVRLVKNQTVERVHRRILEHIRAQGFTVLESPDEPIPDVLRGRAVRVVGKGGYDPAKTPLDLPVCREVIAAVERAHDGQRALLLPTLGGSDCRLSPHRHPAPPHPRAPLRQREQPAAQPQRAPAARPPLPGDADYRGAASRSRVDRRSTAASHASASARRRARSASDKPLGSKRYR
jgi:acetylornithine deacetylase/succinyl-diaminopimelate desuccinylase-like protein